MARKKAQLEEVEEDEPAGAGHNSLQLSAKELKNIVERIESLLEDKKALAEDLKELMAEAKAKGFDTRTVKEVIKFRAMDVSTRRERQELLDLYLSALGLL
jgi:uncharacterized protein (UPF0335 family)